MERFGPAVVFVVDGDEHIRVPGHPSFDWIIDNPAGQRTSLKEVEPMSCIDDFSVGAFCCQTRKRSSNR
ncbi:hypothetical protein SDC9_95971 [bioreactor metagenome]|uniref:Uncharacterized protein n=1 Tax=bioreactor metagenome TaxID=1076179 RepID=A0A645AEH6_9ZZZZ